MDLGSQRGNYALAICTAVIFSFTSISQSRASQDSLCELMPIAVEQSVLAPLSAGDAVAQLSIKQSEGNFGWLTWAGSPSSPVLAASLVLPGNSDTYINPDNASDHILSVGDWAQGSPGVSGSNAVKAALNGLLNVPIVVPVWDQDRGQGNHFDYRVVKFATIALTEYRLTGNRLESGGDALGRRLPTDGDYHAHHIVPVELAAAKKLWDQMASAGIRSGDNINGVWLKQVDHGKKHSDAYVAHLQTQLKGATSRTEIVNTLRKVAEDLVSKKIRVDM